jgi:hypothetical protein
LDDQGFCVLKDDSKPVHNLMRHLVMFLSSIRCSGLSCCQSWADRGMTEESLTLDSLEPKEGCAPDGCCGYDVCRDVLVGMSYWPTVKGTAGVAGGATSLWVMI